MDKYKQLHPSIRNPYAHLEAKYPPYTIEQDALPFIKAAIAQRQEAGALAAQGREYRVSDERVRELHDFLLNGYHNYGETDDVAFEELFWQELEPIVRTHSAVIDFMHVKEDDHSRCYGRWVIDVVARQDYAKAMMVVVGAAYDWLGRPCTIEEDDNFSEGIACDWTLVEARWRQMKTRSALMSAKNALIVGAGYLPELSSKYGGELPEDLQILACDMDERIPIEELEDKYSYVTYVRSDGLALMQDPAQLGGFDVVSLPGVMSYNIPEFDAYIQAAMNCLRPGGTLLFDLQFDHPGMAYIGLMLDWSAGSAKPIQLLKVPEAMAMVQKAVHACGVAEWGYSCSGRYEQPTTLLFELKKPE